MRRFLKAPFRWLSMFSLFLLLLSGAVSVSARAQASPTQTGPGVGEKSTASSAVPAKSEEERDENDAFRQSKTVQTMAHMMGMKPNQAALLFTGLNFLVLIAAVGYFAAKNLPKAFRNRSSTIQKQLVDARTATEEAGARLKAVEARLSRLDGDIAAMRQQAELDAKREDQRAREAMEQESVKILAAAENEIQAATATARRDLQHHAAELAIDQAARRLVITAETDRLLVEGFSQRLSGTKGGQN